MNFAVNICFYQKSQETKNVLKFKTTENKVLIKNVEKPNRTTFSQVSTIKVIKIKSIAISAETGEIVDDCLSKEATCSDPVKTETLEMKKIVDGYD